MALRDRRSPNGAALICSDFDLFRSVSLGPMAADAFERDWAQVRRLARRDGLLPEQALHYPLVPAVTGLNPATERTFLSRLAGVLGAVEQVAQRYGQDVEVQRFLDLPALLHECALAEVHTGRHIDYCRFDLAGADLDDLRIFEVGSDFPGLLTTSGLLNEYWRHTPTIGPLLGEYRVARCEEPGWLVAVLLRLADRRGIDTTEVDKIALLCPDELHSMTEVMLLRRQIRQHNRQPLAVAADRFDAAETPLAMVLYPNLPFVQEPDRYSSLLTHIADGNLVTFNGILGRAVGANKRVLAILSDPRFRRLFSGQQIACIESLVPWSRKLGDDATVGEATTQRAELVLKSPYDAISRGTYIGQEHSAHQWRDLLEVGARQGWLVQEFVPSQRIATGSSCHHRTLGVGFAAGRAVGYTARLSTSLLATFEADSGMHAVFGSHAGGTEPADALAEQDSAAHAPAVTQC